MYRLLVTLNTPEAKWLIGKAVAKMGPVVDALAKGIIVICPGTTNAYVAEEVLGTKMDKGKFSIGVITQKGTCVSRSQGDREKL
jgi:hypothetical protein